MVYFEEDFLNFFKELAANNNKNWFDENRKRYEIIVREPFKVFVAKVIEEIHQIELSIDIEPKDAIFRINRDIRFSKDKTPYKLHVGAVISQLGRKDKTNPGIYFELGPEHLGIFAGVWNPDKIQLEKIRRHIGANLKKFEKLAFSPSFLEYYPEGIKGDKNKRLPKDILEIAQKQELVFNKQFYYQAFLNPNNIIGNNLLEIIVEHYKRVVPLNNFFREAMEVEL